MAVAKKVAYNVALNSTLKVFSTVVLSLYSVRLITEYLGQDGFGMYATMLAFFALFTAFSDLGLAQVTAREISREGADEEGILSRIITLRLLISGVLVLLAPLIIYFFHYSPELKIAIFFAAIATVFSTFSYVLNGIFQKRLAMDRIAIVELGGKVLQVGLIWLFIQNGASFLFIAAALVFALAFNALTAFLLSRSLVHFSLKVDRVFWTKFLKESLPVGAMAIITFTYFKFDTILLSLWQPASQVGIYNVAYKIIENLIFFPAMIVGLILPILSRLVYTDRAQFEEVAGKMSKVFLAMITPLVIGVLFLAPDIVAIISGDGFSEAAPVLRILVFALACIFFGNYFNMLLIVSNAQKKLMKALLFVAVVNILLNFYAIPHYSYTGAAVVSVFTEFLVVVLSSILVYRHLRYIPSFERLGTIFLSGLVMTLVFWLLRGQGFWVSGIGASIAYVGALGVFKAVDLEELRALFASQSNK